MHAQQQRTTRCTDADALLELQPSSADAWMYRGHALSRLRDFRGAARAFELGLRGAPNHKLLRAGFADAIAAVRREVGGSSGAAAAAGSNNGGDGDRELIM